MSQTDFQNGFIAGVATKGTLPLFTGVIDDAQVGDILRITNEKKVGLTGSIELSRVIVDSDNAQTGDILVVTDKGKVELTQNIELSKVDPKETGEKVLTTYEGNIVLSDTINAKNLIGNHTSNIGGILQLWEDGLYSDYLAAGNLANEGMPGQILQIGDDYHIEATFKEKRHILLIGDSYGEGCGSLDNSEYWNGGEWDEENKTWKNMTTWITHVKHNFGMGIWGSDQLDCFENVAISHVSAGGAGFISKGPAYVNEETIHNIFGFSELASCISSGTGSYNGYYPTTWHIANTKTPVTDVVILGGYNDIYHTSLSAEVFLAKLWDEMTKIKNLFPHAKYHIFFAGSSKNLDNRWKLSVVQYLYYKAFSMMKDTVCYPNLNALLNNWAYLSIDGIHPTVWGEEELGKAITTILQGGQLSDYRIMRETPLRDFSKITITSKAFLNDTIYLSIRNYNYDSNSDSSAETTNFIQRMNTKKPIYLRDGNGNYGSFRGTGVNFGEINDDLACFGKGWTDPMITQRADLQLADGTFKVAKIEFYIAPRVEETTIEIQKAGDEETKTEKVDCFLISDYPTDGAKRTTPIYPSLLGVFMDYETGHEMTDEIAWVNTRLASTIIPL